MGNTVSDQSGEPTEDDRGYLQDAIKEARRGMFEGGLPIGAVLVIDREIKGRGRNYRVQKGSPILHAELACLEDAGRLPLADYKRATLYTTLSPCPMCAGAILLYGIPRVVIADSEHFQGEELLLMQRGVEVIQLDFPDAKALAKEFIELHPDVWAEDTGMDSSSVPPPREREPARPAIAAPPPQQALPEPEPQYYQEPEPAPALMPPPEDSPPEGQEAYAAQYAQYAAEGQFPPAEGYAEGMPAEGQPAYEGQEQYQQYAEQPPQQ